MAENKKIKLTDLLGVCLDFTRDPSTKNSVKLTEMSAKLECREYLPVENKRLALILILNTVKSETNDPVDLEVALYVGKIVYGLMAYVVNLENDLMGAALQPEIVDLLFETGIAGEVLSKCEADYNRLCEMVQGSLNFSNIFKIVQVTELYDNESLDKLVEEIKNTKKEFTPEMLQNLKDIVKESSTEFQTIKEGLIESTLDKIMDADFDTLESTEKTLKREALRKELKARLDEEQKKQEEEENGEA